MRRYVPLAWKINVLIIASLIVCIGLVVSYLAFSQYAAQIASTDTNLRQQSLAIY